VGRERLAAPFPIHSPLVVGAETIDWPVARSFPPSEAEKVTVRRDGYSLVRISTEAPEKSPERSGVNDLLTSIDWRSEEGKRSSGT